MLAKDKCISLKDALKGQTEVLSLPEVYMCLLALREQEPVSGWLKVADSLEVSWRQGKGPCSSSLPVLLLPVPVTTCVCISWNWD